jgi:hypothetical protein
MAAYIQLLNRETGQAETFVDIDTKMCEHFGVPVDEEKYYMSWYDLICFSLALGQTYEQIRERWLEYGELVRRDLEILEWLEERYEPKSWMGR